MGLWYTYHDRVYRLCTAGWREKMADALIIGGGPAAISAALTLRMRGKSVQLLYAGDGALEKAHRVDNYPGLPQMSGREMLEKMRTQARDAGVDMKKAVVQLVQPGKKKVTVLAGNDIFTCKALLIATGAPRAIGIPGERDLLGRGVSYCATCDGMFYKGKDVAVIGAFHEAVEDANFLLDIASSVAYYPEMKHDMESLKAPIQDDKVLSMEAAGDKVLIKTAQGERAFDGVFVLRPAVALSQLVPKLETEKGKIITDKDGMTNIPRIYAAGDVTGLPYQMAKAVGEGNRAALKMARDMDTMDEGGTNA